MEGKGRRRDVWRRDGAFLGSLIRASPDQLCPLSLMVKRINTWAKIGNRRTSKRGEQGEGAERSGDEPLIYVELGRKRNYVAIQKRGGRGWKKVYYKLKKRINRVCVRARCERGDEGEVDARAHVEAIGVPC